MERLTNFGGNLKKCMECAENSSCYSNQSCGHITEAIAKLRDYEELEEQGKLLKLPVPARSLVYEPYQFMGEGAWEIDVHKIRLEDLDKIGKTVFLTREEAEAALKEL